MVPHGWVIPMVFLIVCVKKNRSMCLLNLRTSFVCRIFRSSMVLSCMGSFLARISLPQKLIVLVTMRTLQSHSASDSGAETTNA